MAMLVIGELRDVGTRRAGNASRSWDETVLYVLDGRNIAALPVASGEFFTFRGPVPTTDDIGALVALEVGVRAFKDKHGEARYALTAFGRSGKAEAALAAAGVDTQHGADLRAV